MKAIILALITVACATASAKPETSILTPTKPRTCNPEKSKPCGKSCIRLDYVCHIK